MNGLLVRIETTPLDLGRAAHMLVKLDRAASYGADVLKQAIGHNPGSWSYGTPELERRYCGEIFKRFLHPDSDILYVPAAYLGDSNIANPAKWLDDMLVKYGGATVERDEESEDSPINATPIEQAPPRIPQPMPAYNPPRQVRRRRRRRF
jgi:hypothetical protein